jgi:hypothetical protein
VQRCLLERSTNHVSILTWVIVRKDFTEPLWKVMLIIHDPETVALILVCNSQGTTWSKVTGQSRKTDDQLQHCFIEKLTQTVLEKARQCRPSYLMPSRKFRNICPQSVRWKLHWINILLESNSYDRGFPDSAYCHMKFRTSVFTSLFIHLFIVYLKTLFQ